MTSQVGVDDAIIKQSSEAEEIEMMNGCVCCTVRGDLIKVIKKLVNKSVKTHPNYTCTCHGESVRGGGCVRACAQVGCMIEGVPLDQLHSETATFMVYADVYADVRFAVDDVIASRPDRKFDGIIIETTGQ